ITIFRHWFFIFVIIPNPLTNDISPNNTLQLITHYTEPQPAKLLLNCCYSCKGWDSLSELIKAPINKELYPAQQDNFDTSLSNVLAVNFLLSADDTFGAKLTFISLTVHT